MTDSRPTDDAHRDVDPERPRDDHAFDADTHFTGEEYHRDREQEMGDAGRDPAPPPARAETRDLPPDNGQRARVAKDGSVHGSGVGTGGGSPGEDLDSSSASGDHEQVTGGEGGDGQPEDLGPAHFKE